MKLQSKWLVLITTAIILAGCFGGEGAKYQGPDQDSAQDTETLTPPLPSGVEETPVEERPRLPSPVREYPGPRFLEEGGGEESSGVMESPLVGRVDTDTLQAIPTEWRGLKTIIREEGENKKVLNDMAVDGNGNVHVVGVTYTVRGQKIPLWLSFSPGGKRTVINVLDDLSAVNAEIIGLVIDRYQNYWLFGNTSTGSFGRRYDYYEDHYRFISEVPFDPVFRVDAVNIGNDAIYLIGTSDMKAAIKKINRDLYMEEYKLPLRAGLANLTGIAVDGADNIYVSYRYTQVGGGFKAYLGKYAPRVSGAGIFDSIELNEKSIYELANGVMVVNEGVTNYVYVVGSSGKSVRRDYSHGGKSDIIFLKFHPIIIEGSFLFRNISSGQWGTTGVDEGMGLTAGSGGNIYVSGCVNGNEMGDGGSVVVVGFDKTGGRILKKSPDGWLGSPDVPACAKKIVAHEDNFYVGGQFNEMDEIFIGKLNSELVPY